MKSGLLSFALILLFYNLSAQDVIRFYNDSKVGYKNKLTGEIIVSPHFQSGSEMVDHYALVVDGTKRGFIDDNGKIIIPCIYDDATLFYHGLSCVKLNEKYGCINFSGIVIIPFEYDFASDFKNDLARVKRNDKCGFIDSTGSIIVPLQYNDAGEFSEGLAPVKNNQNKWGFINTSGKIIIDAKYDQAQSFVSGEAMVIQKDETLMINNRGRKLREVENREEEEHERNSKNFHKKIFE